MTAETRIPFASTPRDAVADATPDRAPRWPHAAAEPAGAGPTAPRPQGAGRRVVVFGATGSLGRHVVAAALEEGWVVRAVARRPERGLPRHPLLEPFAGDALDPARVEAAIAGADAVICVLGAGRKGGLRAPGTRNIIAGMARHGVRRLICESTLGVGDSRANLNFLWRRIMFGLLLRPAFLDHEAQEAAVRASDLDWTIVRPAAFTDGPETGEFRHGFGPEAEGLTLKISRRDVARFILAQVGSDAHWRAAPGLSG